jgi:hypothetical protein
MKKTQTKTTIKKTVIIRQKWPRVRDLTPTGKKLYVVDAMPHGKREGFTGKQDALVRADQLGLEVENKGTESMAFPTALRIIAVDSIVK